MIDKITDKQEVVVGVDIGGTNTVLGIVDFNNNILFENSFETHPEKGVDNFFMRLSNHIKEEYLKLEKKYFLSGIGLAAPSANYLNGTIESPANLKWGNVNLIDMMKKYFDLPIAIINDANAAALGEHTFGVAKGMKNFIVLTLGTGLGSGIFIDGHLLHGENGLAGELGHTIIEKDGRQCNCGRFGCLETYVSASGIKRTVFNFLSLYNDQSELRYINFENVTSKQISELVLHKDPIALRAFDYTGEILGQALANMVAYFDPQAIILSGGLANADKLLLEPTYRYFDKFLLDVYKGKVQILNSNLQNGEAAVLGACSFVFSYINNAQINRDVLIEQNLKNITIIF
ncbi:MAG: ROK family protein [Ignavibacteriaceae bacterium]